MNKLIINMKGNMKKLTFLTSMAASLVIAGSAFSAGPNLMSYQGQVLTAGGAPVANGPYPSIFTFYPVAVAGAPLWSEAGSITTAAGLFTHTLGSITAIPAGLFANNSAVWLEVSVNGQIQSPRTQLLSASNALSVSTVDSAAGGTITSHTKIDGNLTLGTPSVTNGQIILNSSTSGFQTGALYEYFGFGAALDLSEENGLFYGGFEPDGNGTGGFLYANNGNGGPGFYVDGNFSGGWPLISMNGLSSVTFDLSAIADLSVNLPTDAISAPEILDEPGVASNNSFLGLSLTGTMQDLITVTIKIPAPGYIWLTGKIAEVDLCGTIGVNYVFAQIDETAGGGFISPHWSLFGGQHFPTTACSWESLDCQRVYFKASAGSYTFRLEIMNFGGTGVQTASFPTLTAVYYPTSYGSVTTVASSTEAGAFESAKLMSSTGTTPASGVVATDMYSVDLRELELKASKLEAEAQKARAAVAEARLKEQLNAKPVTADDKK